MCRPLRWIALSLCALISTASAYAEPAGLKLIPAEAELVVVLPEPARLIQAVENHPVAKELAKQELFQALYDNTKFRRFEQLVAYFEKKLGKKRYQVLEQITQGGAVLGARLSSDQAVVVVVQAADEELLKTFLREGIDVVDQELERQDSKDRFRKGSHGKIATIQLGNALHLAQVDRFLIFATDEKLFHKTLDLHTGAASAEAGVLQRLPKKERGKDVVVWAWLDFEGVQRNKEFKEGLKALTTDGFVKLVAGAFTDVLKRTPYVELEISQEREDYRISFHMPRGTKGMSEVAQSFVTNTERKLLPPLTPPRVVSSTTWTFDLGELWRNKKAWLGEEADKELSKAEKTIAPFLGGQKLGDLLHAAGWNQRIVLAEEGTSPYKIKPGTHVSPFAVVFDLRDESAGKALETALRAGALVATFQFGMKMKEEEYKGHPMVAYHFDESRKVPGDTQNIRFNFSPAFAKVGKSFIAASTKELARDLVDCVLKEEKTLPVGDSWRTDLFASGLASNLTYVRRELLTGFILDQGLHPTEANKQLDSLIELVRGLGTVRWTIRYGEEDYRMELFWEYGKK